MHLQETTTSLELIEATIARLGFTGFAFDIADKTRKPVSFWDSEIYLLNCNPEFHSGIGNMVYLRGDNLGAVTTPNWGGTKWGLFFNEKTEEYVLQIAAPKERLISLLEKL